MPLWIKKFYSKLTGEPLAWVENDLLYRYYYFFPEKHPGKDEWSWFFRADGYNLRGKLLYPSTNTQSGWVIPPKLSKQQLKDKRAADLKQSLAEWDKLISEIDAL